MRGDARSSLIPMRLMIIARVRPLIVQPPPTFLSDFPLVLSCLERVHPPTTDRGEREREKTPDRDQDVPDFKWFKIAAFRRAEPVLPPLGGSPLQLGSPSTRPFARGWDQLRLDLIQPEAASERPN